MRSLHEGLVALKRLDLSMVVKKLQEPKPEGQGWSADQVAEVEKWYRRFLELGLRYPDAPIVPNFPIDTMWHQHILDTRAYSADCDAIFGEFLHHYPYFGLNGAEDAANRDSAFDMTNELYRKHWDEDCRTMKGFSKPHVPEDCLVSLHGNDGSSVAALREANNREALVASGCNHGGSGTGCGQGCGRKHHERGIDAHPLTAFSGMSMVASGCNHGGSGTGCGQGCRR